MSLEDLLRAAARRVRDSAPVVALRQRRYERKFATTHEWKNLARGIYRSFEEARQAAPPSMPATYVLDDEEYARRARMESHDYPAIYWLRPDLERGCTLLDFGGHVGLQYDLYRRYATYSPALRWVVCEQPSVAARGRELLRTRDAPHLTFIDDLAEAAGADVFLTAGTIQAVEEPLARMLGRLPRRPGSVLINKVPLCDQPTRVTLHNTGRSFSPCYLFNAAELIGSIEALGYRLVDRWRCPERAMTIPFHPEYQIPYYSGLYFDSRLDVAFAPHRATDR